MQRLEKILAQKAAAKVLEWPSYGNSRKVTQKPHFLKSAKGGPRKIFQKSSKNWPSLQKPNSTLSQMALSCNYNALIVQRLEKILAQKAAPKRPEWRSYGNLGQVTQNPHFLKKCKGGTKGNLSKIAFKVVFVWKAQKHSGANGIIPELACTWSAKTGEDFGAKKRLLKFPYGQVLAVFARSPKTRIFWKSAKGGPREIFQKSPKKIPSLKRPKSTVAQMALSFNEYALKV